MKAPSEYLRRLRRLHQDLGIPAAYARDCELPLCVEPERLADTEADCFGRPQRLTPEALEAWTTLRYAAAQDGIELFLVSAFRDLDYQAGVIRRKLEAGRSIEEILSVNAAPGYSEHHTGRALDVGTPGCPVLEEEFAKTKAYQWLGEHASEYGFHLSYPPDNPYGIAFEPWHWCYLD